MTKFDNVIPLTQEQIDRIKDEVRDDVSFKVKTTITLEHLTVAVGNITNSLKTTNDICNGRILKCVEVHKGLKTETNNTKRLVFIILLGILGLAFEIFKRQ